MRMVILRKSDHSFSVESADSCLVQRFPGDGGRGGAGPVQSVPGPMVRQTLH